LILCAAVSSCCFNYSFVKGNLFVVMYLQTNLLPNTVKFTKKHHLRFYYLIVVMLLAIMMFCQSSVFYNFRRFEFWRIPWLQGPVLHFSQQVVYLYNEQVFKFKTAQNSKNLRFNGHISFEFQTRNYITCFGHICINYITCWRFKIL